MEVVLPIEVQIPSLRVLRELYQQRMIKAYNKKVQLRQFREGDLVLTKILPYVHDHRGKWTPKWEGPYVVKTVFSGGALILVEMDRDKMSNPVNSDAMKKYFVMRTSLV
ncbi:hypothetical protein V6Z11_D02G133700 [Gossypium hirsutum]